MDTDFPRKITMKRRNFFLMGRFRRWFGVQQILEHRKRIEMPQ